MMHKKPARMVNVHTFIQDEGREQLFESRRTELRLFECKSICFSYETRMICE